MIYLSQLMVNLHSRPARNDLADRYELHRTLLSAFPETLPAHERVLYRVEEGTLDPMAIILVQSLTQPDWGAVPRLRDPYLLREPRVRQIVPYVQSGDRHRFRLQANPTVKRDGKRHAIYDEAALLAWLQRKGEQHGFAVGPLDARAAKLGQKTGQKRRQTWHAVQFDGILTVMDSRLFVQTLQQGIGSAKAFGFGLLSIPYSDD